MICIVEMKTVNVEGDFLRRAMVERLPPITRVAGTGTNPAPYIEVKEEHIHGATYVNARGEKVCVGLSQQVRDTIGLPLASFEMMKVDNEFLKNWVLRLENQIKYLELPWYKKAWKKYKSWNQFVDEL